MKSLFSKKAQQPSKWDTIVTAIKARQYRRAIRGLYDASPASKRQFLTVVSDIVRKEIGEFLKSPALSLCQEVNVPNIRKFSWEQSLSSFQNDAPLTFGVMQNVVMKKKNDNTLIRGKVNLKPRIGMALSGLLHARSPRKASFIQTLLSIQFWRGGLKRELLQQLSNIGICVGYMGTLSAIDKIRIDFDSAAVSCKTAIEDQLAQNLDTTNEAADDADLSLAIATAVPNIEDEINEQSGDELDETIPYNQNSDTESEEREDDTELDKECSDQESVEDEEKNTEHDENMSEDDSILMEMEIDPDITVEEQMHAPGFTLCWDNVGKKVMSRHPTQTTTNKYINMALGYMSVNRITSTHLPWSYDENLRKAADLDTGVFLPSREDFDKTRYTMEVLVGRILCRHLSWFRDNLGDCSLPHILHDHTEESSHRSVLINLGVFDVDPSSTQGAIAIYEHLQRYVPSVNEKPYTTVVFGDGLSCERGNDAHKARSNGLNSWERLEGVEPAAQEFHKEMLLLQDYFDIFFKASSSTDRGTLCQIKNLFNYRQVKSDVADNFNYAWELMCLITEGFVCLLAMKLFSMEDKDSAPKEHGLSNTSTFENRKELFDEKCKTIVQHLWHSISTNILKIDDGTGPPIYCCGEELDEEFIACLAGDKCRNGELFHYSCAEIDINNPPQNWYCSDDCENFQNEYGYCRCRTDLGEDEPMIGCAAGEKCLRVEWYHMKCVNIDSENIPTGDWYCNEQCRNIKCKGGRKRKRPGKTTTTGEKDKNVHYKENYSRAIAWCGLQLLCRRDAVREGDGEAMIRNWKYDLLHFFTRKHPKYLILAHRLIASVNGWLPEKLRFDLIHNRTVNYGGGVGRNLPLDFMNEVLNRLFKDLLGAAKGRYTDTTIQRCSQIVGPLGEALDVAFDTKIVENEIYRHRRREQNRDKNVEGLISFLKNDDLFAHIVGRKHRAFPDFNYDESPPR